MKRVYLAPLNVVYVLGSGLFCLVCLACVDLFLSGRVELGAVCLLLVGLLLLVGDKLGLVCICKECSNPCNVVCRLQQQFGDPTLIRVEIGKVAPEKK